MLRNTGRGMHTRCSAMQCHDGSLLRRGAPGADAGEIVPGSNAVGGVGCADHLQWFCQILQDEVQHLVRQIADLQQHCSMRLVTQNIRATKGCHTAIHLNKLYIANKRRQLCSCILDWTKGSNMAKGTCDGQQVMILLQL